MLQPGVSRATKESLEMTERRVTRAIVLAAGTGSRLSEGADVLPKPLRVVGGVPLVVRVLRTLKSAGIQEAGRLISGVGWLPVLASLQTASVRNSNCWRGGLPTGAQPMLCISVIRC